MALVRLRARSQQLRLSLSATEPEETMHLNTDYMTFVRHTVAELKLLLECMNEYITAAYNYLVVVEYRIND